MGELSVGGRHETLLNKGDRLPKGAQFNRSRILVGEVAWTN